MSRYRFIDEQRNQYPVRLLCQVVAVPASGYYAWQQAQQPAVAPPEPAWETALIKVAGVHKRCYGTRRLSVALRKKGHRAGRQRLRAAMRHRGPARAATQGLHAAHHQFDPLAALRAQPAA